jgi:hypothetical protein
MAPLHCGAEFVGSDLGSETGCPLPHKADTGVVPDYAKFASLPVSSFHRVTQRCIVDEILSASLNKQIE